MTETGMHIQFDEKTSFLGAALIDKIKQRYPGKYIADLCIKDKYGNWLNQPAAVFYQENPPHGYSNYFAILHNPMGSLVITSGDSAVEGEIVAAIAENGQPIISAYRHDYKLSDDGSVFIDGGRDYVRSNTQNLVTLRVVQDKLEIVD